MPVKTSLIPMLFQRSAYGGCANFGIALCAEHHQKSSLSSMPLRCRVLIKSRLNIDSARSCEHAVMPRFHRRVHAVHLWTWSTLAQSTSAPHQPAKTPRVNTVHQYNRDEDSRVSSDRDSRSKTVLMYCATLGGQNTCRFQSRRSYRIKTKNFNDKRLIYVQTPNHQTQNIRSRRGIADWLSVAVPPQADGMKAR